MADLRAIIFDFDGTIADSEPLHLAAFQAVLSEELDLDLTEEEYAERYLAFDDRLLFTHVLNDRGVAVDPDRFEQLLEQKEARYQEIALAPQILPGAAEMIRAAAGHWPLAIASGALGPRGAARARTGGSDRLFPDHRDGGDGGSRKTGP